jgi:RNA-directed DNA polymerase
MHPEKSRIVYCKDSERTGSYPQVQFTFLGFTFRPRKARDKQGRIFTSFLPGASNEAMKRMRQTVLGWRLHRQTPGTLAELARQHNPVIRGWWNYFGSFYRTVMYKILGFIDRKLEQWARRKYKTLCRHKQGSTEWLCRMKSVYPRMFFHWGFAGNKVG